MPRILLALSVLFAGCAESVASSNCGPAMIDVAGACVFDEAAALDLITHFDDGSLVKMNRTPFAQYVGDQLTRNVWLAELPVADSELTTVDLYDLVDPTDNTTVLPADFPAGTVIVHEAVERSEGHGVLVKRDDGYENAAGEPWWFGKVYDDGTYDLNACLPCESCHTEIRAGTEGLWGVPVEAR